MSRTRSLNLGLYASGRSRRRESTDTVEATRRLCNTARCGDASLVLPRSSERAVHAGASSLARVTSLQQIHTASPAATESFCVSNAGIMQEALRQEPLQQVVTASAHPEGQVPTGPERLEKWHKRFIRVRVKLSPSSSKQRRDSIQPNNTRLANHVATETAERSSPMTIPMETLPASEQQNEAQRTLKLKQQENHKRILDDEETIFDGDVLQNWLSHQVGKFLSRNNLTADVPTFFPCLKEYDANANKHERMQYIAINVSSDAIDHKSQLAAHLMHSDFWHLRQEFEIKVFGASGIEFKGYVYNDESKDSASATNMQVSLSDSRNTLCGAQITLASNHHESGSNPLVWTSGGLISVQDRIYALTVSHPLSSQEYIRRKSNTQKKILDDSFDAHSWGHLGQIAAFATDNGDWMLIDVQKQMQLPNATYYSKPSDAIIGSQSGTSNAFDVEETCQMVTSHGIVSGTIVRGSSILNFGSLRLRTLQIRVNKPLGMLAVRCTQKELTNMSKFREIPAAG
jgi:hypothetical protein